MPGDLRGMHRSHSASRCQAKDPSTCPYHGSTSDAAVSRGDINGFLDAKEREKKKINVPAKPSYAKTYDEVMNDIVSESGKLKKTQKVAAEALAKMYDEGTLEASQASLIKFSKRVPEITKDNKTIGVVFIGNEGNPYFYETDGSTVTFRQADGHDKKGEKLPWNYGMRKKLDGAAITENNIKWGAQAMLARYGF